MVKMRKTEADIRMTVKNMFAFHMRQQYWGFRGIVALFVTVLMGFLLATNWNNYTATQILLLIFGLILFVVYMPLQLLNRAKRQVLNNEGNKITTHYMVNEEGITVTQNETRLTLEWAHIYAYKTTPFTIYIYTSRISAFIFPKGCFGKEGSAFIVEMLKKNKRVFGTKSIETIKQENLGEESVETLEEENETEQ